MNPFSFQMNNQLSFNLTSFFFFCFLLNTSGDQNKKAIRSCVLITLTDGKIFFLSSNHFAPRTPQNRTPNYDEILIFPHSTAER